MRPWPVKGCPAGALDLATLTTEALARGGVEVAARYSAGRMPSELAAEGDYVTGRSPALPSTAMAPAAMDVPPALVTARRT